MRHVIRTELHKDAPSSKNFLSTVKLGDKERFDKEQFLETNFPIYFITKGTFGIKEQF